MRSLETEALISAVTNDYSLLSDYDLHLFNEGAHNRLYEKMGAHPGEWNGKRGVYFAVWAPDAEEVNVFGDFNGWNKYTHHLRPRGHSGIWEGFIPGLNEGTHYKYYVVSRYHGYRVDKADPFAVFNEVPPRTASIVRELNYEWRDQDWMQSRHMQNSLQAPMSVYEMHIGSWMRVPEENNRSLTYREMAPKLADYLTNAGFTHVEFMPVMEHPFGGSWGYQITGFFAPTSRFGTPQDFMYLVDYLHQKGIGVILDWVPSHFPADEHGLAYFDGTHLYEHADTRQGFHPDWKSYIFNYGRNEVRSFLLSSAIFWLDRYHADGLRVDAVASMLYLDYSRKDGEWIPNRYGGRENLDAISFLQRLNHDVYQNFPSVQTIAEESTAWPMVSKPTYLGGLGFGLKWDMGWMHDTLVYMSKDPVHRRYHHHLLTFRGLYAFTENFVLPLSHDEVVHGKGSLLDKMPGDEWQKRANLRVLLGYMWAQSGKKLLFMGGEFGQWQEWNHDTSLEWHLLQFADHQGLLRWVQDLNRVYRHEAALHALDIDPRGFEWIDANDGDNSVLTFMRKTEDPNDAIVVALNFTPVPRDNYRVGVPQCGYWRELLNSDAAIYGGSGMGNGGGRQSDTIPWHNKSCSISLTIPPLGALYLKR
ncbi:MAG: 1,4-alpha-glucan branching protein GlgB [Terriglobales bacterium]